MTGSEWVLTTAERIYRRDVEGLRDSAYQLYAGAWRRTGRIYNYGTPIYEQDWDLLVVLDACRYDLLREVAKDYEFLDEKATNSVGSATEEWIAKNFTPEYQSKIGETVYVTGNPHSTEEDEGDFRHLEEVWSHSWDNNIGTTRAEEVTEYAIAAGRELQPERCIVHYMQPHHPFVPTPELNEGIGFGEGTEHKHIWEKLRHGAVSHEEVWEGYRENLRYVLNSVDTLLTNYDADTAVVTSDHGNAMGEFGIYGHPMYVPISVLKRVPYCRTTATDTGEVTPSVQLTERNIDEDVSKRLEDLGYA